MPFRATFNCLWCGTAHACHGPDDLEGWAQLCPDCVGKAGDNGFLRFRLHRALIERGSVSSRDEGAPQPARVPVPPPRAATAITSAPRHDADAEMLAYYEARAPEYDDWYLRRGRYERGPIHDAAWNAELDAAGRWLDGLPIHGEIVELAAGTGWWSPLLASKGELSLYDAAAAPLERARERLVAHGLRAHLHVRDAWAEPDRPVDAVFTGFWLSHVARDRLDDFLSVVRRWLKPGGTFAFIDSRFDPQSSASDHSTPANDTSVRRLDDGREFTIVKVYYEPRELEDRLRRTGFERATVTTTGRFFLTGVAMTYPWQTAFDGTRARREAAARFSTLDREHRADLRLGTHEVVDDLLPIENGRGRNAELAGTVQSCRSWKPCSCHASQYCPVAGRFFCSWCTECVSPWPALPRLPRPRSWASTSGRRR